MRLAGRWRIVDMELWDAEAIDLVGPGFIEFDPDRLGRLGFIAVEGQLDWREVVRDGRPGAEFTWEGSDDGDPVSGRGWAVLTGEDTLDGRHLLPSGGRLRPPGRPGRGDAEGHRCHWARRTRAPVSDPAIAMQRWEQRIEAALDPGRYVSEQSCFAFVRDLEEVAVDLAGLVATDPGLAVALHETFVAGCTEKANEVDDSSGEFGSFVVALVQGWVSARQAAGARPDRTASRLLAWVDDDPFGFCHGLVQDVAEVLDPVGRTTLIAAVRARFEAALPRGGGGREGPGTAVPAAPVGGRAARCTRRTPMSTPTSMWRSRWG